MSRVTSKLQVTIPKVIADKYRIRPGDEVRWEVREPGPMMIPEASVRARLAPEERVARLRGLMEFVRASQEGHRWPRRRKRDWTRQDLYEPPRGLPR
jgi:AbrB family looped-hinge helix DNA binding protein